jgi:hypothetical protein
MLFSSCGRKSNQQDSSSSINPTTTEHNDSLLKALNDLSLSSHFTIDTLIGYSFHYLNNKREIEVSNDSNKILTATIYMINNYNLQWVKKFDSVDIVRGHIIAHALNGPSIGEPDGCETKYSIDSLWEYQNKNNTRCFFLRIKGIEFCDSIVHHISYYQGYFVDVSYGKTYKYIEIPDDLDDLNNKEITEVSEMVANSIKRQP